MVSAHFVVGIVLLAAGGAISAPQGFLSFLQPMFQQATAIPQSAMSALQQPFSMFRPQGGQSMQIPFLSGLMGQGQRADGQTSPLDFLGQFNPQTILSGLGSNTPLDQIQQQFGQMQPQLPQLQQLQGQLSQMQQQIPGMEQLQQLQQQMPGMGQLQQLQQQMPGMGQLQQLQQQMPGSEQLQQLLQQVPQLQQLQQSAQQISTLAQQGQAAVAENVPAPDAE